MIPAGRFIADQWSEPERWHAARKRGVTATQAAKAATPKGFTEVLAGEPIKDNPYMAFGRWAEPLMMRHAHEQFGILPTGWLLAAEDPRWLASPDGLSVDHTLIAECKTTGDPWDAAWSKRDPRKLPIKYRRQCAWQLLVSGAERCLFLWQARVDVDGRFEAAWFEPRTLWIEPDKKMQTDLLEVAERLWEAKTNG